MTHQPVPSGSSVCSAGSDWMGVRPPPLGRQRRPPALRASSRDTDLRGWAPALWGQRTGFFRCHGQRAALPKVPACRPTSPAGSHSQTLPNRPGGRLGDRDGGVSGVLLTLQVGAVCTGFRSLTTTAAGDGHREPPGSPGRAAGGGSGWTGPAPTLLTQIQGTARLGERISLNSHGPHVAGHRAYVEVQMKRWKTQSSCTCEKGAPSACQIRYTEPR